MYYILEIPFSHHTFASLKELLIVPQGTQNNKKMTRKFNGQIITLAELKEEGKRVAFIKGNRMVQEKNVNAKWASLREYGQCTPAVIIDGE